MHARRPGESHLELFKKVRACYRGTGRTILRYHRGAERGAVVKNRVTASGRHAGALRLRSNAEIDEVADQRGLRGAGEQGCRRRRSYADRIARRTRIVAVGSAVVRGGLARAAGALDGWILRVALAVQAKGPADERAGVVHDAQNSRRTRIRLR